MTWQPIRASHPLYGLLPTEIMIYVSGPGHGGPAVVGNTYLEGRYSEIYPDISQDEAGHKQYIDKHGQDLPEIRNWTWRAHPS